MNDINDFINPIEPFSPLAFIDMYNPDSKPDVPNPIPIEDFIPAIESGDVDFSYGIFNLSFNVDDINYDFKISALGVIIEYTIKAEKDSGVSMTTHKYTYDDSGRVTVSSTKWHNTYDGKLEEGRSVLFHKYAPDGSYITRTFLKLTKGSS